MDKAGLSNKGKKPKCLGFGWLWSPLAHFAKAVFKPAQKSLSKKKFDLDLSLTFHNNTFTQLTLDHPDSHERESFDLENSTKAVF